MYNTKNMYILLFIPFSIPLSVSRFDTFLFVYIKNQASIYDLFSVVTWLDKINIVITVCTCIYQDTRSTRTHNIGYKAYIVYKIVLDQQLNHCLSEKLICKSGVSSRLLFCWFFSFDYLQLRLPSDCSQQKTKTKANTLIATESHIVPLNNN